MQEDATTASVAAQVPAELEVYLSVFENVKCKTPKHAGRKPWREVVRLFNNRIINPEKSAPPLISFAEFVGTRRTIKNVKAITAAALDFDNGTSLETIRERLKGIEFYTYSTHGHTSEKTKCRVIVPFSRPLTAAEYAMIWAWLNNRLDGKIDPQTKDASRISYWPSCPEERRAIAFEYHSRGEILDPDVVLSMADNSITPAHKPMSVINSNLLSDLSGLPSMTLGFSDGQRTRELQKRAGHLLGTGHSYDDTLAQCRAWNEFNDPPLDDDKIIHDVKNYAEREAAKSKSYFPYGYSMRADGLYWDNPGSDEPAIRLSSPFEIVAETRDAHGEAWGILLRWKDADGHPHEWAMPRSLLAGDATEVRAQLLDGGWYVAPNSKARNLLTSFFMAYRTEMRARCVDRTGWHGHAFVTPGRTYGDTKDEVVILQTGAMMQECKARGTLEGWQKEVAAPAAGNSRIVFAIATAFAGPLLYLLGEESGGVHIKGPSSIGKTTALHAAASVWGYEYDSWRTTDNAAENLASRACDSLLSLDEIGQAEPRCVEALSYLLSNGQGKKRMKREGGARKDKRWRVLVLSTGEVGLAEKLGDIGRKARAGQSVRLLEIPADAGAGHGMFENLHGSPSGDAFSRRIKEATAQHTGHAAPLFLERITADTAKATCKAIAIRKEWLEANSLSQADGQVSRAAGRFALVAAAGELAIEYGILPWSKGEAMRAAATCFKAWIARRGGVGSAETMSGVAQVREFLEAHGSSRFEVIGDNLQNVLSHDPRVLNRAGYREKNKDNLWEYHILPAIWRNEICKGHDATAIAKEMKAGNMMITDSGRNTHSIRVPGHGTVRVYSIAASFFGNGENAGDDGDTGDIKVSQ